MSDSAVPPPPLLARDDDEDLDDNVENNYQSTGESFGDLPPTYGDDNNVNNARYADELDYDAPTRDDGGDSDLSDLEEVDLNALPARSTTAPGGAAAGDDDDDGFEDRSAAIPARRAPPTTAGPRGSSKQDEDDDQDEDDYGGEDLGDGRRKRRRGGAGAGRKRRGDGAAGAGGDGEDGGGAAAPKIKRSKLDAALVGLDEETKNRVLQMQRTADAASRGPSRRRARDIDVKEFDLQARHFCDQLIRASNQDRDAHAAGKPALGKLRMLPKLKLELDKADMVSQWLDAQVLSVFLEWLTPFTTDGALPAHEVRRELFRYLVAMPISSDHLLEVKIGPLVVFYSKYPKETMEIRKMAQECYRTFYFCQWRERLIFSQNKCNRKMVPPDPRPLGQLPQLAGAKR
ncbi:hypothetical protein BC828DRAFT_378472 [Blastocladiella britannica]|nr:hypothetical protein BC828DRAFT_378472 [Blastocladiella britannica]